MEDLTRIGACDAAWRLARRELSAERYVGALLERIEAREPAVRAFVHLDRAGALEAARRLDAGPVRGPLHGLPIGVKDIFETHDMPTQGGSAVYAGHQPRNDAACIALARAAGAIVLGKTVTTELATFPPNETRHPLDPGRSPGGSSSGSAAAVADFMLPLATGTQTLGSTIRPASYCGIVGYKPTFNLIPKKGVWSTSDTLDTVGVFGRSVPDAALFVAGMLGYAALRPAAEPAAPRIGLCRTFQWERAGAPMQSALEQAGLRLARAGATVREIALPGRFADLLQAQTVVAQYELGRSLADEYHRHGPKLRPALFERLGENLTVPAQDYQQAMAVGRECRQMIPAAMLDCDVLLAPAAVGEAPQGLDFTGDPILNQIWTFLHVPCVAVPAGTGPAGMPLGLQVIGRLDDDIRTLAAAHWIHHRLALPL